MASHCRKARDPLCRTDGLASVSWYKLNIPYLKCLGQEAFGEEEEAQLDYFQIYNVKSLGQEPRLHKIHLHFRKHLYIVGRHFIQCFQYVFWLQPVTGGQVRNFPLKTLCQHNVFRFGSISDFRLWDWGCLTYNRYFPQPHSRGRRSLLMLMKVWRYQIALGIGSSGYQDRGKQAELLPGWGTLMQ